VALTFGLIVLAMIYAVGDVSDAHLNPAATIGFFAAHRPRGKRFRDCESAGSRNPRRDEEVAASGQVVKESSRGAESINLLARS